MGEFSKIEWTTHTFNPWLGCQKISAGCDNCYAEALMDHRLGRVEWGPHGERRRTSEANWRKPRQWAKAAKGTRPRVFCASLADVFDNQVPPQWRADLWHLIEGTPELDWLLLTKRPENMAKMLPWKKPPRRNVWLGVTAEDQAAYERRWPILEATPARVRFVSYEPALGPLDIGGTRPDWIICGGESGPNRRPFDVEWARHLREQCRKGVPFFMKQIDKKQPIPADLMVREHPHDLP